MILKLKYFIKYFLRFLTGWDISACRVDTPNSFEEQKKLLSGKRAPIIFDIGANMGQTTRIYRKIFRHGRIFGFEPFPQTFVSYKKSIAGDRRAKAFPLAISDKTGTADFFVNDKPFTNSLLQKNDADPHIMKNIKYEGKISVKTETVDNFCFENKIEKIDILKIDVQGGELKVLEGANDMLKKHFIGMIYTEVEYVELYKNQPLFSDIKNYLEKFGYILYDTYNIGDSENGERISADAIFLPDLKYRSQYGQDRFLDSKIFFGKKKGVFIEMGADDGITGSNTFFFEKEKGWTGLCIEPRPEAYEKLLKNRSCLTFNGAISTENSSKKFLSVGGEMGQLSGLVESYDKRHLERVRRETAESGTDSTIIDVPTARINDLLGKNGLFSIDYFSLDTEGGELEILRSLDFEKFRIECIGVENKFEDSALRSFLKSKGYRLASRIKIDDIFVRVGGVCDKYHEPLKVIIDKYWKKLKSIIKKMILFEKIKRVLKTKNFREISLIAFSVLKNHLLTLGVIKKSLDWNDRRKLMSFFNKYVGKDKLVFDVGANKGNKLEIFLALGNRVIAIEPQSELAENLKLKYRGNEKVEVERYGLGKEDGVGKLNISDIYNGFSSFDPNWQSGTKYHTFSRTEDVPITTLDKLIAKHGLPYFCKIDVEGMEPDVLYGLSKKIPLINFEFHSNKKENFDSCVEKLGKLGYRQFNCALNEDGKMEMKEWVSSSELWTKIEEEESKKTRMVWGDIYAR